MQTRQHSKLKNSFSENIPAKMKSSIFEYTDYKKLTIDLIEGQEQGPRGQRKKIAEAMNCQVSHVTNVLSGEGHLSLEQAEGAARFFGLTSDETEFYLLLVQYQRAGTGTLKTFFEKVIRKKRIQAAELKERLEIPDSLSIENSSRYYGQWYYAAVHVLTSIPEFQTREAIAKRMKMSVENVDAVLEFLLQIGLIKKEGLHFKILKPGLHLERNSPMISRHHANWRMKTMQQLEWMRPDSLHYSSVVTFSRDDFERVKETLTKALKKAVTIIEPSPSEEMYALNIDCFLIE